MAALRHLIFACLALLSMVTGQYEIPDTYDAGTGEYYSVTSSTSLKQFLCTHPTLCSIECSGSSSCDQATITASSTATLILRCIAQRACQKITVHGPTDTATVECVSQFGYSCRGDSTSAPSTFRFDNTNNVNIVCDQETNDGSYSGSCYYLVLWADNSEQVSVTCANKEDCKYATFNVGSATSATFMASGSDSLTSATINAATAGSLSVTCNEGSACYSTEIWPPYSSQYVFDLFCLSSPDSCYNIKIKMVSSLDFTTNFMELICPRTDTQHFTNVCDIDFYCSDLGTYAQTTTSWSNTELRYQCNDQDCCPWIDYDNIVQSTTTNTALPHAISPTSTNDTAEVYELSTAENYRMISCSKQACSIECKVISACFGVSIYAGMSEYLSITCSGTSSCERMYITQGPSNQADIVCSAKMGKGCRYAVLVLSTTPVINMLCSIDDTTSSYAGNCYSAELWAEEAVTVDVNCEGEEACDLMVFHLDSVSESAVLTGNEASLQQTDIYAASAHYLEINCNSDSACANMDIYPPYQAEYAFKMYCSPHASSCSNVDVYVPLSTGFIDNYMELLCARTNTFTDACDVGFRCADIGTSIHTLMSWSSTSDDRFICNDNDCCPWPQQGIYDDGTLKAGTIPTILPNSMDPTSEDATGQYYTITADSTSLNEISCTNSAGCFIKCTDTRACEDFVIYAGDTDYLELICSGSRSCDALYITAGPKVKADINCTATLGYACATASFIMDDTDIINLFCDSDSTSSYSGGCYSLDLWALYAGTVNIHCLGDEDCVNAVFHIDYITTATIIGYATESLLSTDIYARHAGRLNMECKVEDTCYSTVVYPPYQEEYIFRLTCGEDNACRSFGVKVPNNTVTENNYMSLRCPDGGSTTSYYYSYCDIDWHCTDDGTYAQTSTTYDKDDSRYECQDDDCCPWRDANYMIAPKECIYEGDEFCGYSLFMKGFNMWTLELSGNSILEVSHLGDNLESWTDEGGSCSLSTLEFAHSYDTYMDYAEQDATNIAGSYSTGDTAAGGSLSTARTSTKKFAARDQSYIYSMDVSCVTATASLVATNVIYWNDNFINSLRVLPRSYDSSDVEDYIAFWDSYGTHIMKTAELGGLVRGAIVSRKCDVVSSYGDESSFELCLNGAYKGVEVAGCHGESSSSTGNNTAHLLVSNTQIDVKGGDTSTFNTLFNKFKSKSTDFQSWIDDLAVMPDIIGGNLDEIHDIILNAITLGNHRLNDDLSSANQLTDTEWQSIANALKDAYIARSESLSTEDTSFDPTITECEIPSCEGGTVDEENCVCTGCGSNDCCRLTDAANRRCVSLCILIFIFFLLFK